jgi:hypothetical protein
MISMGGRRRDEAPLAPLFDFRRWDCFCDFGFDRRRVFVVVPADFWSSDFPNLLTVNS